MPTVIPYDPTPKGMEKEAEEFLTSVQSILGHVWTTYTQTDCHWQFRIVHPNGPKILIECSNKKQYRVSGAWLRDSQGSYYQGKTPAINISRSRGVEAVVRDIKRRFLNPYLVEFDELRVQVEEVDRLHQQQKVHFQELCEVIGYKPSEREEGQAIIYRHGLRKIEVGIGEDNTVKIETSYIPFEDAKAILELFAKRIPEKT